MNIANSIHHYAKQKINRKSKIDGRLWVTAVLLAYFGLLYLANFFVPYQKIWDKLGIPTMTPLFADLRGVLAGFECTRLGYDALYNVPCDPYNRGSLPYPRLWMKLEWLGLNQSHSILLGVVMAISFYLVTLILIGKLNNYEAFVYSLILCSPPIMLLIERANVDIIIYILFFFTLVIISSKHLIIRFLGYMTLLLPIFLKLLPIFSLSVILKENRKNFIFFFSLLLTTSIVYFYHIYDELKVIKSYPMFSPGIAFGYKILPYRLNGFFSAHNISARKLNLILVSAVALLIILSIAMIVWILISLIKRFENWLKSDLSLKNTDEIENYPYLDSFRIGASLYLGTLISTASVFNYKLSFLIFAIPQIIFWIKRDDSKLGMPSSLALLGIVTSLYFSTFLYQWLVDEIINWFLWIYFLYTLIMTLPDWIEIQIHNSWSVKKSLS